MHQNQLWFCNSDDDNYLELLLKWWHLQNKALHGAPARDRRSGDRAHAVPWIIVWVKCGLYKWPICGLSVAYLYGRYMWPISNTLNLSLRLDDLFEIVFFCLEVKVGWDHL